MPARGLSINLPRAEARRARLTALVIVAGSLSLASMAGMAGMGAASPVKAAGSQPILKPINPAQAKLDTGATPANGGQPQGDAAGGMETPQFAPQPVQPQQPYTTGSAPAYPSESQLPDFNKPLPQSAAQGDASGFLTTQPPQPVSAADEQRVTRLEQTAFGSTYPEHEVEDRVDHLEKEVFGNTSSAPIDERLAKLEAKIGGAGTFNQSPSPKTEQPPQAMQPPAQQYPPPQQYQPPPATQPPQQQYPAPSSPYTPVATTPPPYQNQGGQPIYQTSPPAYQGGPPPYQGGPPPYQGGPAAYQGGPAAYQGGPAAYQGGPAAYQGGPPAYQGGPPPYQGGPPTYPAPVAVAPQGLPLPPPASTMVPPSAKPRKGATQPAKTPAATKPIEVTYPPANADYFAQIKHFPGDTVARWRNFPVRVHLPVDSPESWRRSLDGGVYRWKQIMPVKVVTAIEPADIEVIWVNHLPPQYLGQTKLSIAPGQMQVQIEMLRPTFYLPEIPERELQNAFLHELGHGLGIFGHSDAKEDLMSPAEIVSGGKGKGSQIHFGTLNDRDIKTLKHIYGMPPVPPSFSLPQPLQWGCVILH